LDERATQLVRHEVHHVAMGRQTLFPDSPRSAPITVPSLQEHSPKRRRID
jgi:hypothetical protein